MLEKINNNPDILIVLMLLIIGIGIIIMFIPLLLKKKTKNNQDNTNIGLTDTEINKIDKNINKEELTNEIFTLYKKIEVAKSKFDYNTLKELLIESFYKEEEEKLKTLKNNKQKLVATNIKLKNMKVLSIQNKDESELIDIYLHVSQYDYIIDNKKKVIRGTDEAEYQVEYKMTLEKNKDNSFKINKINCIGKWIKN